MSRASVEHHWVETTARMTSAALSRVLKLIRPYQEMTECPKCGSASLHRSPIRYYEKFRRELSSSRPYRCGDCRVRVWGHTRADESSDVRPGANPNAWGQAMEVETLDLSRLDESSDIRPGANPNGWGQAMEVETLDLSKLDESLRSR